MANLQSWAVDEVSLDVDHPSAAIAALNAGLRSLTASKDTNEAARLHAVLESAVAILTLVGDQDEVVGETPYVDLANLCSRVCHVLVSMDDLGGLGRTIEDLGRTVRDIESAVRRRENHNSSPGGEYITVWRAKLREILDIVNGDSTHGSALEPSTGQEHAQRLADSELDPTLALAIPMQLEEPTPICSNASLLLPPEDTNRISERPPTNIPDSNQRALERLVSGTVPQDELSPLITAIVSDAKATDLAKYLQGSDAQVFVDTIGETLDSLNFAPRICRKCVKVLYKACAVHTLLPSSLRFELPEDTMGDVEYRGGSANVLKLECGGRQIAVKALRARDLSLQEMKNRFCKEVITWKSLRHSNVLPLLGVVMTGSQFAMVSEWMINGNINEFITVHQDVNRFELLADVAKGLIHMHCRGMVHGDLKGANILIDGIGRACLADFGLLTITSDTNITSPNSFLQGGTCRWMSPELFDPEEFGFKDSRPTKNSDRYAFGMVIYEVLSGRMPFSGSTDYVVVAKVLKGERPARPRGAEGTWFVDDIWNILESCWKPTPDNRPRIKDVLHRLEEVSRIWTPSQMVADPQITDTPTRSSDPSSEESPDESEASSPSLMVSPQQSRRLPLKAFGAKASYHSGSEEPERVLEGTQPASDLYRESPQRRRRTRNYGSAPAQPLLSSKERKGRTVRIGTRGAPEKALYVVRPQRHRQPLQNHVRMDNQPRRLDTFFFFL